MGLPEQPIEGMRLENIRLICKGGGTAKDAAISPKELGTGYPEPKQIGKCPPMDCFARHVKGFELANMNVDFITDDLRPAAFFADVEDWRSTTSSRKRLPACKPRSSPTT